ncbi:MAG: MmgE/PrpD family protein [Pseudomonadales bacterium]|nr:MmgE/PrpD family protein [Pseudomonadales bacterium]
MDHIESWNRYRNLRYQALPERVKTVAGQCVLDWFACAIAGSEEPLSGILRAEFEHRHGACTVIGAELKVDALTAALLNGSAGHALDFDDTSASIGCHATAPVFPAALALAEELGASGERLMTAFVVGVEVEGRVGNGLGPEHYGKGWHTTSTLGVFGAAAAAAHLLGFDDRQFGMAIGLAASQASGLKANFGTMTKPFHAGHAAERGLLAARLAARGFTANADAVAANQGLAQAAGTGSLNIAKLAHIADRWLIEDSLFKYHAACYLTHAAIESTLRLRTRVSAADLSAVTVTVNPALLDVCAIMAPRTGLEGKFSLTGTMAMAFLGIDTADQANFVDAIVQREDVQSLLGKIRIETDASLSNMQARVMCVDRHQRCHDEAYDAGIPATDLDAQRQKLDQKFLNLSQGHYGARASQVRDRIDALPSVRDLSEFAI